DDQHGEQCDDGNNLPGDGCSPNCSVEPPATAMLIPGKGSASTDCALEWAMDHPTLDRKGVPSVKQSCKDGAACDVGNTAGECSVHLWICANNHDARLPLCAPGVGVHGVGTLARVDVLKPSLADAGARPVDAANRQLLQSAGLGLQGVPPDTC